MSKIIIIKNFSVLLRKNSCRSILFLYAFVAISFSTNFICASNPSKIPTDVEIPSLTQPHPEQSSLFKEELDVALSRPRKVRFHHSDHYKSLHKQPITATESKNHRIKRQTTQQSEARTKYQSDVRKRLNELQPNVTHTTQTMTRYPLYLEFTQIRDRKEKLPATSSVMEFEQDEKNQDEKLAEQQELQKIMLEGRRIATFIQLSQMSIDELKEKLFTYMEYLSTNNREELKIFLKFVIEKFLQQQLLVDMTLLESTLEEQISELNRLSFFLPENFKPLLDEFLEKHEYQMPPASDTKTIVEAVASPISETNGLDWNFDE